MMKRFLALVLAVLAGLVLVPSAGTAATSPTYGDYSLMFNRAYGLYGPSGSQEWAQVPQDATTSDIYWGAAWKNTPPAYHERFVRNGDWVRQLGWFDNGTFYSLATTAEWTAAADCRSGKTFFATGTAPHYARWLIPAVGYCTYVEATITEQSSGKSFRYVHQQVWSPPGSCPKNPVGATSCISQWESWADDRTGTMTNTLERTAWLGRGTGPALQINQTVPSAWSTTATAAGKW